MARDGQRAAPSTAGRPHDERMLLLADRAATASPLPLVTARDARVAGLSLPAPGWSRVRRGVYVDEVEYEGLPPWVRYAVRVHAFARVHPDAVLCLESAAVLHGLPLFGETRDIHVYDPDRAASRRFGDVFVHASHDPRSVGEVGGVLATDLTDTVVDLARALPPAPALAVVDASISPVQGGTLDLETLRSIAASRVDRRHLRRLRWVWEQADAAAESPAESISRAAILWSGFERPVLQREFRYEGARDRVDFFFASTGAVGESDGWGKYGLDDPNAAAQVFREEKRREDRLRRHGHPFARWDLQDAVRVDPLVRALTAAGVPLVRPAQPAMLATLRSHPRTMSHPR